MYNTLPLDNPEAILFNSNKSYVDGHMLCLDNTNN